MEQHPKYYAFIDSQNLNLSVKNQGWSLDFKEFYRYLKDKHNVTKVFLFIGYIAGNQSLYTHLQEFGYILVFKPTLGLPDNNTKGNVDADLVLHAMIEKDNFDKAIIVSGDGDFHCLIEYLESKEKLGRVIIPNRKAYSQLLGGFKKHMDYMNNLKDKLKINSK